MKNTKLEINKITVETGGLPAAPPAAQAGETVANDISLSVSSGELVFLMGPNGSGKSSVLKALLGHPAYRAVSGEFSLDGENITALPTEKKARLGIFLSLQELPEIQGVTLEQFLYRSYKELHGKTLSPLEFRKYAEGESAKAGLDPSFLRRPVNAGFSGGEKKMAEALQLFILKPKFALLDEPDSGVDRDSLEKVFKVIELLRAEGVGFLLVTHYPSILKRLTPNRVYLMKSGRIKRSGGEELAREIEEKGFGE